MVRMGWYCMEWDGEGKRGAHSGRASAARNLCCLLLLRPISAKTTAIMIGATFAAAAATHAIWPRCHGRRGGGAGAGPTERKGATCQTLYLCSIYVSVSMFSRRHHDIVRGTTAKYEDDISRSLRISKVVS